MSMTKRVAERMAAAVKALKPVIEAQRARDVSEADTVTLVKDVLSDALGYNKYAELSSEHSIRGTYCDIAVQVDGKLCCLIEVKAVGIALDDRHVKQAIDYASNKGCEWCMLTNGAEWRLYHVIFAKPIDKQLVAQIDVLKLEPRKECDLEQLFLFSKEGFAKGVHVEARDRLAATSRFLLAALLLNNEDVLSVIRRELRKIVDLKVDDEDILPVLEAQVIKRDCLEGPEAETARSRVNRSHARAVKAKADPESPAAVTAVAPSPAPAS